MTKRIKILFIMFQGGHTNLKSWNEYTESKFLDRLKKLGSVYCYQDKTYNIWHYDKSHPEYKDYDMDIDFNLSYVRPNTHIKMVYRDIIKTYTNIDEYKFIPIGWSLGCWLALYFAQVYSSQCSHVILLESSLFTPNNMKIRLKDLGNIKNFSFVTNAKYKKMLLDWKTNNTNIEDAEKIRDLNTYIRAQFISKHLNLKLPVPTTAFVNIKIVKEEKDLIKNKKNLDEVKIVYCYKIYFLRKYILYKRKLTLWTELKKIIHLIIRQLYLKIKIIIFLIRYNQLKLLLKRLKK